MNFYFFFRHYKSKLLVFMLVHRFVLDFSSSLVSPLSTSKALIKSLVVDVSWFSRVIVAFHAPVVGIAFSLATRTFVDLVESVSFFLLIQLGLFLTVWVIIFVQVGVRHR
ncbi:uncharacterized protein LOC143254154 isoform X2 [Tachypleus tridentatus]|uniref:uncharacterized protein LOC143254154 isoform X2 n=1 Tax=Tachypleus tridentatus TaxID=6853 RepID=UPI003FD1DE86